MADPKQATVEGERVEGGDFQTEMFLLKNRKPSFYSKTKMDKLFAVFDVQSLCCSFVIFTCFNNFRCYVGILVAMVLVLMFVSTVRSLFLVILFHFLL